MPLASPLPDPVVELYYSGAWQDITADVVQDGIQITYAAGGDPASMTLTLLNTDGTYSPRNPTSPLYGLIGRNTPIRCSVAHGSVRVPQPTAADRFTAPDTAALSITGDLDLRVDLDPLSWRPTTTWNMGIVKDGAYFLWLTTDGTVMVLWYDSGATLRWLRSTIPVPGALVGRKTVRVTLDVDDGAGGRRADFYTGTPGDLNGTWTLFDSVTESGTTTVLDSAGTARSATSGPSNMYALQIRDGIGGTVVAWPDFEAETAGTTSFADGYGNTWTATGDAEVTNRWYRFWGEVSSWPQRWGPKGGPTVHSPIQCAGPLRRLGQGASPVQSAMRRGSAALSDLEGYWPGEDGDASTSLTTVVGVLPGRILPGVDLAAYDGFAASAPIPTLESGRLWLPVAPAYTHTGEWQVRFLARVPAATPDGAVLARVATSSSLGWVDLLYTTGGGLTAKAYTRYGVLALTVGPIAFDVDDRDLRFSLECKQNGAYVDVVIRTLEVGAVFGDSYGGTTGGANTLGAVTSVYLNPDGAALEGTAVGHVTVQSVITSLWDLAPQINAYTGDEADQRMYRLAYENDVWLEIPGGGEASEQVGGQGRADLLTLLREAADTDNGFLFEPVDDYALQYRTLRSLCGQDPAVAITWQDNLLRPFEPVEDDQQTRNKVTVTRAGGASATAEDITGRLGTQPPPDGIGVYDEAVTVSLAVDDQAIQQASWRVHAGTVDEARWPSIGVDLVDAPFLGDGDLTRDVLGVGIGDRITVTGLPAWLPPDDVDQVVVGWTETITPYHWRIEWACLPAATYRTAVWDGGVRWGSDTSTLAAAITSGATSFTVAVAGGVLWDDGDGPFDVVVGGEVMAVGVVSGTSSPQTFSSVTRSVNGVVKSHSAGAKVILDAATVWSL